MSLKREKVLDEDENLDRNTLYVRYTVKFLEVYKAGLELNIWQKMLKYKKSLIFKDKYDDYQNNTDFVYSASQSAACGVFLKTNFEYLLFGKLINEHI